MKTKDLLTIVADKYRERGHVAIVGRFVRVTDRFVGNTYYVNANGAVMKPGERQLDARRSHMNDEAD